MVNPIVGSNPTLSAAENDERGTMKDESTFLFRVLIHRSSFIIHRSSFP